MHLGQIVVLSFVSTSRVGQTLNFVDLVHHVNFSVAERCSRWVSSAVAIAVGGPPVTVRRIERPGQYGIAADQRAEDSEVCAAHGAWPDSHSCSRMCFSRSVSMHCQNDSCL